MFDFAKSVIDYLTKRREASTGEFERIVPQRRLYDIFAVPEAAGLTELTKTKVTWMGGLIGIQILVEGPIDSVTSIPI